MTIVELITMARARLEHLSRQRETAVLVGDLAQLQRIDADVAETQTTLNQLLTLA
jgi:hypothetical protein